MPATFANAGTSPPSELLRRRLELARRSFHKQDLPRYVKELLQAALCDYIEASCTKSCVVSARALLTTLERVTAASFYLACEDMLYQLDHEETVEGPF